MFMVHHIWMLQYTNLILHHAELKVRVLPSGPYTLKTPSYAHANKYADSVVLRIALAMFDLNHILQGYFNGTETIIGLPHCRWSHAEEDR